MCSQSRLFSAPGRTRFYKLSAASRPVAANSSHYNSAGLRSRPSHHAIAARFQRPLPLIPVQNVSQYLLRLLTLRAGAFEIPQLFITLAKRRTVDFASMQIPTQSLGCASRVRRIRPDLLPESTRPESWATDELLVRTPHEP